MNERDKTAHMMQDSAGSAWGTEEHFQRFADLIRADERDAIDQLVNDDKDLSDNDAIRISKAIRARGNK